MRYAVLCFGIFLGIYYLLYTGNQIDSGTSQKRYFSKAQMLWPAIRELKSKIKDFSPTKDDQLNSSLKRKQAMLTPTGSTIDSLLLDEHIRFLVKSMISNDTMLDKLSTEPTCIGEVKGEVEDILCRPMPDYFPDVKNPCWFEKVNVKGGNTTTKRILRCLPYFHILGVAKSATTDLWNRMMEHPHLVHNEGLLHKEALWWSWGRYGLGSHFRKEQKSAKNFTSYIDRFRTITRRVASSLLHGGDEHTKLITGDASPPDFWDFRGWRNISQNRGLSRPRVITPHLMAHFYASPRFILMFRDPVERLYSDYFFVRGGGSTSLDFHKDVKATIHLLARCVREQGLQKCFNDDNLYKKMPVRLSYACYSVYLREWLAVFPIQNFLFLNNNDYADDQTRTLKDVFSFLDMSPLNQSDYERISEKKRSRVTTKKSKAGEMMKETKIMLHRLLDPCTAEINKMTKTPRST